MKDTFLSFKVMTDANMLQGGSHMIVSAIQNGLNNKSKNNNFVKPVTANKNGNKTSDAASQYQLLLQQAMMVYRR